MTIPNQRTSTEGLQGFSPSLLSVIGKSLRGHERAYITLYWHRMRKSNEEATHASNKWQERNAFLKEYCRVNQYTEHQTREKMRLDYALNDAMDAWSWHTREAARCESVIAMELSARLLLGLVPDAG